MPPQSCRQFLGSRVRRAGPNSAHTCVSLCSLQSSLPGPHWRILIPMLLSQTRELTPLCRGESLEFKEDEMQSQVSQPS